MSKRGSQKNIFVVLGMARSGTSAITRGLKALGVDLGEKLSPGRKDYNPKGFWEDNEIVHKISRRISAESDDLWMSVNRYDDLYQTNPRLRRIRTLAVDILSARMAQTSYWGFKDPNTSTILPFWQSIFRELNLNDDYLIALRNPLASAYSYQKINGGDLEDSFLMWITHLIPAIEQTHGKKRIVVSYEEILQHPHQQLERIRKSLNIPLAVDVSAIDEYAHQFLDKKLHHYDYHEADLTSHPIAIIAPLCAKMYAFFLKLASDQILFESDLFLTTWKTLMDEFEVVAPLYRYVKMLLKRSKQQEKRIRTIEKSIPWKVMYPLRVVDNVLRDYRKQKREKKKLMASYG